MLEFSLNNIFTVMYFDHLEVYSKNIPTNVYYLVYLDTCTVGSTIRCIGIRGLKNSNNEGKL